MARLHPPGPGTAPGDDAVPAIRGSQLAATGPRSIFAPTPRPSGTAPKLRKTAVPRLAEIAQHLRMARHEAWIEDLLEESRPSLHLWMRPSRGPLGDDSPPPLARLDLVVGGGEGEGEGEQVLARLWLDQGSARPAVEIGIPAARLGLDRLTHVATEFVKRVLSEV